MKFSEKNKNKIVGGIITIIILVISSLIGIYFNKQNADIKSNENYTLNLNDSASSSIIDTKQENSNTGNVTNEYVMGNKVINNGAKPTNEVINWKSKDKQPINKIENNGNLSIGQKGGVVNQTTLINPKPSPRHLSENDITSIITKIPPQYSVDVSYPLANKESEAFSIEILKLLTSYNYKITRSAYGQISPDLEESFSISINNENKTSEIIIYRQK